MGSGGALMATMPASSTSPSTQPPQTSLSLLLADDCTAGVWLRQQGGSTSGRYMQVACFQGHTDSVMRAAWSSDGRMVATGSSNGVVCLWQPVEAALTARRNLGHAGVRQLGALEGHPEEVYACLFLPPTSSSSDGGSASSSGGATPQRLVTASGESLFLWDVATQRQLQQVAPAPPPQAAAGEEYQVPERWRAGYLFGLAVQPDGPLLGAACSDGRLRLWSRDGGDASLSPLCTLPWNQAMGADCCFGLGGLFCAVSKDGSVVMMDVRQGACLQHLKLETPLLSCTLLPDGSGGQCLAAAGADGGVHFVDVTSGKVASLFPEEGPERPLLCATLSADGSTLAASGEAVVLGEHDLPAGETQEAAAAPGHQRAPKWSPIHVWQRALQR
ncbi:DNA-binding isoform A [Micractinium conductrix]|uniref:DNA-binding isoform A n=1 Tax=Micractinium conductrix TaxID=554055 RepID=A0A2P6VR21_9CHLO|nr:DNA-binding isoform A [Micractinium conductrix]|eukprot:PSC76521.1 DNA-binding isoform A [Micractinium conductrix]